MSEGGFSVEQPKEIKQENAAPPSVSLEAEKTENTDEPKTEINEAQPPKPEDEAEGFKSEKEISLTLEEKHRLWEVENDLDPEKITQDKQPELFRKKLGEFTENASLFEKAINSNDTYDLLDTLRVFDSFLAYFKKFPDEIPGIKSNNKVDISIHDFLTFETELINKNFDKLEKLVVEGESLAKKIIVYETITDLVAVNYSFDNYGADRINNNAVNFLLKNAESTIRSENEFFADSAPIIATILEYGSPQQKQAGEQLAVKLLKDGDVNMGRTICRNLVPPQEHLYQEGNSLSKIVESAFGLNGYQATIAWAESLYDPDVYEKYGKKVIERNLTALLNLEKDRPGIGKVLQSEFGINDFSRYPEKLLIEQYDLRDKKDDLPYGTIFYPHADHNGAFYQQKQIFEKLHDQFQGKYRFKVFENGDLLGLISNINHSRHRYGPMSFAMIGGHGIPDKVVLGEWTDSLDKSQLKHNGAAAVKLAFTENPTIILISCSTGELGGIGQEISKLGATVIAPPKPAAIEDIFAILDTKNKIIFQVKYFDADLTPEIYTAGIPSKKF